MEHSLEPARPGLVMRNQRVHDRDFVASDDAHIATAF